MIFTISSFHNSCLKNLKNCDVHVSKLYFFFLIQFTMIKTEKCQLFSKFHKWQLVMIHTGFCSYMLKNGVLYWIEWVLFIHTRSMYPFMGQTQESYNIIELKRPISAFFISVNQCRARPAVSTRAVTMATGKPMVSVEKCRLNCWYRVKADSGATDPIWPAWPDTHTNILTSKQGIHITEQGSPRPARNKLYTVVVFFRSEWHLLAHGFGWIFCVCVGDSVRVCVPACVRGKVPIALTH